MKRYAQWTVKCRNQILAGAILLVLLCAYLTLRVPINTDMTKYLPDDSSMKQGIDLLAKEFPDLSMPSTIRAMIPYVDDEVTEKARAVLEALPDVSGIAEQQTGTHTLFTVSTLYNYRTNEELALERGIREGLAEYDVVVRNDDTTGMVIPVFIFVLAAVMLLAILFIMCASWVEPFLFLAVIGGAIVLNLGTNLVLGSVSQTTYSMSAVLQLVLSMDYSIILMNRYRQEKQRGLQKEEAMREALQKAFASVTSSGLTTFVGLIMLVFMHFKMGKDLGLVLAKGVFLSMVCVLTVLPGLIVRFDGAVERTRKPALKIRSDALAAFSYRVRRVLPVFFIALFAFAWYMQSRAGVSYALQAEDPIAEVFPSENAIVLLFPRDEEETAAALVSDLEARPYVTQIYSYVSTLGRQLTAEEMADYISRMSGSFAGMLPQGNSEGGASAPEGEETGPAIELKADDLKLLYSFYAMLNGGNEGGTLSIEQVLRFVLDNAGNPLIAPLIPSERKEQLKEAENLLSYADSQLRGETAALMMISTTLPLEGEETESFVRELRDVCADKFSGDCYLIGNSVMGVEMKDGFGREQLLITLLTAFAIFIVVAVTFRQLVIPLILVLLVQCGVYLAITTTCLIGYDMYYLAVVIIQCVLMGATVDYGILFTGYYREMRRQTDIKEALRESYGRSMHTILTSSLFMIIVTGAIGISPADPTIAQICLSLSIGAACALLLVTFILPGLLAGLDRFVVKVSRR